jgi:hypothetical protein
MNGHWLRAADQLARLEIVFAGMLKRFGSEVPPCGSVAITAAVDEARFMNSHGIG